MREYHAPFHHEEFYHVFNRGNNKENLFKEDRNFSFFLGRWDKYLLPYIDVWSYCLMPNHFHFLIKVKDHTSFPGEHNANKFLENQFKRLFSSYTLSFNKVYVRNGSLFQKRFKRVKIDSESYLFALIHYIHHNPIHHNFVNNFSEWKYSSYSAIIGKEATKISRNEVLNLFGGKIEFIAFHNQMKDYKQIKHLIIE